MSELTDIEKQRGHEYSKDELFERLKTARQEAEELRKINENVSRLNELAVKDNERMKDKLERISRIYGICRAENRFSWRERDIIIPSILAEDVTPKEHMTWTDGNPPKEKKCPLCRKLDKQMEEVIFTPIVEQEGEDGSKNETL